MADNVKGDGGSNKNQYGIPAGAKDLQDLIEHRDMSFAVGNIFKACYRLGIKNDNMYELNKIKWFAQRLIDLEKKDEPLVFAAGFCLDNHLEEGADVNLVGNDSQDEKLETTEADTAGLDYLSEGEACEFFDGGYCYNKSIDVTGCVGVSTCNDIKNHKRKELGEDIIHSSYYFNPDRNK